VDSLRAYLTRDRQARSGLRRVLGSSFGKDIDSAYRHVMLHVTVTATHLSVGLSIHPEAWWDGQNLVGRCSKGEGARELALLLRGLPGFVLQVHEHREHPTTSLHRDQLERALRHYRVGEHYFRIVRRWEPDDTLAGDGGDRGRRILEDVLRLVPPYRWIAWAPENQHLFPGGGGS
jgi:hypothetical protein